MHYIIKFYTIYIFFLVKKCIGKFCVLQYNEYKISFITYGNKNGGIEMKTKKLSGLISVIIAIALCLTTILTANAVSVTLEDGSECPSSVYIGDELDLKASSTNIFFYSSDKSIATITLNSGKFVAINSGTVTISAKTKTTSKTVAKITITVLEKHATGVTISPQLVALEAVGDNAIITASLVPNDSTDTIRFSSNNTNIANVDSVSGEVIAMAKGITTVNVYVEEKDTSNISIVKSVMVSVDTDCRYGDANGDGIITIEDISAIQKHTANINSICDDYLALSDINDDGSINVSDATLLQMYLVNYNKCGNAGKIYGTIE